MLLSETHKDSALVLLEKAVKKAQYDEVYSLKMEEALLCGSTIEVRELLSHFGDYFGPPRSKFPFYPHTDAVNGIDSALHVIKFDAVHAGSLQEHIDFVNNK